MSPAHELHTDDDQLWIGWEWFEFHAKQRIEMVKFFITIFGAVAAGAAGFLQTPYVFVSACLSVIGLFLTITFWQLDHRSIQLIEIGETILGQRWTDAKFPDKLNPVILAQARHDEGVRFKHALLILFIGAGLLAIGLFAFSIYLINYPSSLVLPKTH